jgi:hypothetical protein
MTPQDAYPRISHMFGAYFHQDWGMEGGDWPDLVRNYAADQTADLLDTAGEIDQLLSEFLSDPELDHQLYRELGCYYLPRPDLGGPSVRAWLAQVSGMLRRLRSEGFRA